MVYDMMSYLSLHTRRFSRLQRICLDCQRRLTRLECNLLPRTRSLDLFGAQALGLPICDLLRPPVVLNEEEQKKHTSRDGIICYKLQTRSR